MSSRIQPVRREITAQNTARSLFLDPPEANEVEAVDRDEQPRQASSETTASNADATAQNELAGNALRLELLVTDREVVEALQRFDSPDARENYALTALKIGIAALQVASGRIDADVIQRESANLLQNVSQQLNQHTVHVHDRVNSQLREYFDPESGRFNERVKRLVSRDGELEQLLRRQIGAQDSELAKTLMTHFGEQSPLMKQLSPNESEGLLGALRGVVEEQLRSQRERVLQEFSLDNTQGALSRLVTEITKNHGQLNKDLQAKIDDVVKEFSLDQENSALSRLVRNVDMAQKTIVREFSLDNPASAFSRLNEMLRDTQGAIHGNLTLDDENAPLARLKRELLGLLKEHSRENVEFREEVKATLAKLVTRREEAEQTTRHGIEFEDALGQFLQANRHSASDVIESLGSRTGQIKNCKVGDFAVTLSEDCQAAGARIVLEAKEDANYHLARALEEIQTARKNRDAQIGIFVFSAKSAPPDLDPFARYGDDLVVIWDADRNDTDVYLRAALSTARALCVRAGQSAENEVDLAAMNRAILEIEKRARSLDDIRKSAETIQSASNKILERT
ncbi:MAG: hypothetical protein KDB23_28040, partial [Planctomycetales bacterium]|nr:hypothetical protein [Planctomycetales bacterium]